MVGVVALLLFYCCRSSRNIALPTNKLPNNKLPKHQLPNTSLPKNKLPKQQTPQTNMAMCAPFCKARSNNRLGEQRCNRQRATLHEHAPTIDKKMLHCCVLGGPAFGQTSTECVHHLGPSGFARISVCEKPCKASFFLSRTSLHGFLKTRLCKISGSHGTRPWSLKLRNGVLQLRRVHQIREEVVSDGGRRKRGCRSSARS